MDYQVLVRMDDETHERLSRLVEVLKKRRGTCYPATVAREAMLLGMVVLERRLTSTGEPS